MFIRRFSLVCYIFFVFLLLESKSDDGLVFTPLSANIYESRLGAVFTNNDEKLRLDIGGNYDLYQNNSNPNFKWAFGAEFFTYTRLRSEGNFKFPVETTDFYFGVNLTSKFEIKEIPLDSRLRVAHISTHLSDGFSSNGVFFKEPFVYSREFFDIAIATRKWGFRPYFGSIFVFSYIPKDVNLIIPQMGVEYIKPIIGNLEVVVAYDFKIDGCKNTENNELTYKPMNMIVAGVIYRTEQNRGILLKLEKYFGKNYYGQFYKTCDNYFGIGFELLYH